MNVPNHDRCVPTEMVLASDGAIYVALDADLPEAESDFVGYALHPAEIELLGSKLMLGWASTELLALGSDGRIYVHKDAIQEKRGRLVFRGFKVKDSELAKIIEEFHLMALNLTIVSKARRRRKRNAWRG